MGNVTGLDAGLSQAGQGSAGANAGSIGSGGASAGTSTGGVGTGGYTAPAAGGFPVPPPFAAGGKVGSGGMNASGGQSPIASGGRPTFPTGMGGTPSAGGSRATGGASAGGSTGTSVGGSTGTSVGGGASGPMMCASNEKMCGGVCAAPSPKVGCGMTGCDPCTNTAPANGYVTCVNGMCSTDCLSGYTKMGDECQAPPPSQGTGSCPSNALGCPSCGAVFGPGCCAGDKCGCSPIPWTIGVLGCV